MNLYDYFKKLMKDKGVRTFDGYYFGIEGIDLFSIDNGFVGYKFEEVSKEQAQEYERVFFECYLVVDGDFYYEVPRDWGVISIVDDDLVFVRKAKQLRSFDRGILLNALEDEGLNYFISSLGICGSIDYDDIARIGESLEINKFKSIYYEALFTELRDTDDIIKEETKTDSTNTARKGWLELYLNYRGNYLTELKKKKAINVIEDDSQLIPYTNIEVSLGSSWISEDIVKDFICYLLNEKIRPYKWDLYYEKNSGIWRIEGKSSIDMSNVLSNVRYGIKGYTATEIIEATLNLREIQVRNNDGSINEESTLEAIEKQKLINKKFKEWIWQDKDRIKEVEAQYNSMFGKFRAKHYDGSKIEFEGKNPQVFLYNYQKNAIKKIIEEKSTLLAFDVGTGKTYIMIAAAMELKKLDPSRKCMFVVPNNIVGQWSIMFKTLYPKANIISLDPKSFKAEKRNDILKDIKDNDYDGIIVAYSTFELIGLSNSYLKRIIREEYQEKEKKIEEMKRTSNTGAFYKNYWKTQQINNLYKKIDTRITRLQKHTKFKKGNVAFNDLGITNLFVDEAHNFKNLPIDTRMKNIKGINPMGSDKCLALLYKIRCVQSMDNSGIVFATGTPLTNSISDVYTMQYYLQHEELEELSIDKFDNWVKTFAQVEQVLELDVDTSKYRFVRRFRQFHNLPELSRMFSSVADFYSGGLSDDLPEFESYTDIVLKRTDNLKNYMESLVERTENIRAKLVDRHIDNMLKVTTDGRKAALDLTLVGENQDYDENSKVYMCAQNVYDIYTKYEGCSQLIFCDYSTPKGEDFSVYKTLKDFLINRGVGEDEIQFIHSCKNEDEKLELYQKVNEGKVRVLIGSSFKLGIGANVQTKLKAIHHVDVPWRPSDMVQREGRIIRKGNENKEIFIYRYIIEGSFDAYSWQILESKQTFISQFLIGTAYQRTASDLEDNVLSYAEVKALALSSNIIKEVSEKQNELKKIKILHMKELESKEELKAKILELQENLEKAKDELKKAEENRVYVEGLDLEVNKQLIKEFSEKLNLENGKIDNKDLGTLLDFKFSSGSQDIDKKPFFVAERNFIKYTLACYEDEDSRNRSLYLFFKKFGQKSTRYKENVEKLEKEIQDSNKELDIPYIYKDKVLVVQKEYEELVERLKNEEGLVNE